VNFNGDPQFNPDIILEVEYSFRDTYKQKRYLILRISDKLSNPKIQFTIDEEPIDEGDAVSYILFGKRMEELTQSQQQGVNSGDIAANIAASFLASQISSKFGESLNLDVVELSSEDNWNKASFTAGKYITNDIFVQYERGFGKDDDGTIDPQIFTLEYQLTRLLYIHLVEATNKTSGADVIIKIE
jgi:autotransporter translocation and assembly factor TamB